MLTFLSAALNPCLYSLLNRTFRQALIRNYKKLNVNVAECCTRQRDNTRNGQTCNNVSNIPSHTGNVLPHNGDHHKQHNKITAMSVSKLEDGRPNGDLSCI